MSKSKNKIAVSSITILNIVIFLLIIASGPRTSSADQYGLPPVNSSFQPSSLNPFRLPPNPWRPLELEWPEQYIDPTVEYGLGLVLPKAIQQSLDVDVSYDRWKGVPTFTGEYFLPVKAWKDKSVFLAPRLTFGSYREGLSVGVGFRQLLTAETLVGFYAFHDWVRPRGSHAPFLKEAGIGFEVAALPGWYSDLSLSANAYFPTNDRWSLSPGGDLLVHEALPAGGDVRLGLLLPPVTNLLDARINAEVHSYRGERTQIAGYTLGLALDTRDGMLSATMEQKKDNGEREEFRVGGRIMLAFDWLALVEGKMPLSAPYQASETRYSRRIRDSLYQKVARKHDLPTDRIQRRITLAARVWDDTVSFSGGFPGLANSRLTVQTARSPWRDRMDVVTDSRGFYSGQLRLAPGRYKLRLVHKPSGRVSRVKTITIQDEGL
ncbi:MAG: inverse autotransporter beta domain-containing protein [Deltaproteobacteria bacterium]